MTAYIKNLFGLEGKNIIVTGASRGIGLEIASSMSLSGAQVVGIGRSPKTSKLSSKNFEYIQCDINDIQKFIKICEKMTKNKKKNLDVLVNCAGISLMPKKINALTRFELTIQTNLTAVFACCDAAYLFMKKNKFSSIINITSIGSIQGFSGNPGYVASKGGLGMLTKALAIDYAKKNVRVNSIVPGYIHTDMTSLSFNDLKKHKQRSSRTIMLRWGSPKDIASASIFLASKASNYITGSDLVVDGGWLAKGI